MCGIAGVIHRDGSADVGSEMTSMDLRVEDPEAEVIRLQGLGATVAWRVDETDRGGSKWTTMASPQGTLFCVCPVRDGK